MWGRLDGDATSYGFVVELRDGRRAYFDYDNYSEDEFVEHVSLQPMGAERFLVSMGRLPIGTMTLANSIGASASRIDRAGGSHDRYADRTHHR